MDSTTLYAKLNTVPPRIKAWLGSDTVIDVIDKLPHQFNLPEYSSAVVSKLIQKIQAKDISPENFAGELSLELNLDKNKALPIIDDLRKNIFIPLKNDFAAYGIDVDQLEKFNPSVPSMNKTISTAPKMIQDISSGQAASIAAAPKPATTVMPAPTPKPISAISYTKIPAASEGKFAPMVTKVSPLSPTGWSKATVPEAPKTVSTNTGSGPAPIMLHEDATFKSTDKTNDFHLSKPGQGAEVSLEGIKGQQAVKPAVLELGTLGAMNQKPAAAPPKFTHYTELSSDRNLTEITVKPAAPAPVVTPAAPKVVVPVTATPSIKVNPLSPKPGMAIPQPPRPSSPSLPPQAPQGKIVQRNYP